MQAAQPSAPDSRGNEASASPEGTSALLLTHARKTAGTCSGLARGWRSEGAGILPLSPPWAPHFTVKPCDWNICFSPAAGRGTIKKMMRSLSLSYFLPSLPLTSGPGFGQQSPSGWVLGTAGRFVVWVSRLERRKAGGELQGILPGNLLPILRQEAPWHHLTCKLVSWALKTGKAQARAALRLFSPSLATQGVQAEFGRPSPHKGGPGQLTPCRSTGSL